MKTKQLAETASSMTKRVIPTRAVLTDYQPHTIIAGHVELEIESCEPEALATRLHRLVAFKKMTFNGRVPTSAAAGAQTGALVEELAGSSASTAPCSTSSSG